MSLTDNVHDILDRLPPGVRLEAAAKTRSPQEVTEALEAGVHIIGENYVQEGDAVAPVVHGKAPLHFIGHLQRNKVKKAVALFDMIETVDSVKLAREIDKRSEDAGKVMDILIEINSGREAQKFGVFPEDARGLIEAIADFPALRIRGLMTMGPYAGDPEESRPYFRETKACFEALKALKHPHVEMRELSMGMSHSFETAIEEGATIIRLGTRLFGERIYT